MQQIITHQHNLCFDAVSKHNTPAQSQHTETLCAYQSLTDMLLPSHRCCCVCQCLKDFSGPNLSSAESRCLNACFHRFEDARQAAINTLKDKMQSAKR